ENEEEVGVSVEAEVYRRVTIVQSSGEEERIVVRLPTRIGPLDQRIEYTLTDRGGMTLPVLLGRRMLRDLALVDVAREYVQPCPPR
ncbi:MAG: RimK/LysX family protein, partial [Halofilum sp. (in: g-proteobacteria)]